ncbi:Glutamyl-tRNA(Gln) amidotransferase subunit [Trichinella pseudospiralis]
MNMAVDNQKTVNLIGISGYEITLPCGVQPDSRNFVLEWIKQGHGPIYTMLSLQDEHQEAPGYKHGKEKASKTISQYDYIKFNLQIVQPFGLASTINRRLFARGFTLNTAD